ncbi:MAG: hypothetical protein Q7S43_03385 [bacterium]|nr:hypothetical protein [bacterium]
MKKLFISFIIIGLGLVFYFGFNGKDKLANITADSLSDQLPPDQKENVVEPDKIFAEPVEYGSLKESYSGQDFSFKYPDGFKVSSNPVNSIQEIVTVENKKGSGFQIFLLAFDESGPITPERIHKDLPDAEINDPKDADLDGEKTLVFNGYDQDMGETFEAWVIYKDKLYQIAGPKTARKLITETLETWRWK